MVVLNAVYKCKEGMKDEFPEIIKAEGIDSASRSETGNIKYDYYTAVDDQNELLLIEKWQDADAFASHSVQPHFAKLGQLKARYVVNTTVDKYEI